MADSAALEAVLASAKKGGEWTTTFSTLIAAPALTLAVVNAVPTGRSFGVIHQIAYWGSVEGLKIAIARLPGLNLKLLTKQGQTPLQVAQENKRTEFVNFLQGLITAMDAQAAQAAAAAKAVADAEAKAQQQAAAANNPVSMSIVEAAKNGKWTQFRELVSDEKKVDVSLLNTVPGKKRWGCIHQLAYWGKTDELDFLTKRFGTALNLGLETSEPTPQTALDIAKGRGNKDFATALALNSIFVTAVAATPVNVTVIQPTQVDSTLNCIICLDEFPKGKAGVICSVDHHFTCGECFSDYVMSESNVDTNTTGILTKGGVIFCAAEKIKDGCKSPAFPNKLVAANVNEATYDLYLKARDFVVGKDATAKALQKLAGGLDTVEQEQIRNLFKNPDGSYRAYMCKNCKFGPVDHGWCSNLSSHNEEKKSGGGVVKNSCPRCKWFASDISQWPKWNGTFQTEPYKGPMCTSPPPKLLPVIPPHFIHHPHPYPMMGRPFSVPGGSVCSPLVEQTSNWCATDVLRFATKQDTGRNLLTDEEAAAVGRHWAISGQAEHASVASFARHTLDLMSVGAPPDILRTAQRAGVEEVGHAQLCFALAKKYGVAAEPGPFPLPASSPSSLLDLAIGVATEGCVAEFGSCIVASYQAARAAVPAVQAALRQIAREEAGHCMLAWRTLVWAVNKLSPSMLSQLQQAIQRALDEEESSCKAAMPEEGTLEKLVARLPGLGLLSPREEAAVRFATAQAFTHSWTRAVLSNEKPVCPDSGLLAEFNPSLSAIVAQIHQAVFYNEPCRS